jgi:RNA polymerase sigma-70 factor, ECF subfamily
MVIFVVLAFVDVQRFSAVTISCADDRNPGSNYFRIISSLRPISGIGELEVAEDRCDLTQLLRNLRSGDDTAAAKVVAAAYGELRKVAARCMRYERPGHTLQPTALVNEAFLRLVGATGVEWQDRAHFYAVAARLMRQILVDHARRRRAGKRDGGARVTFDDRMVLREDRIDDVIAIDEVLARLETLDARQGRIVELRFFAGMSVEEIAEVIHASTPTVKREWSSAKAWLHRELTGGHARAAT